MNKAQRSLLPAVLVLAALGGCQTKLMPTPNLYVYADENPWAELPPELKSTTVDLFYYTDREPIEHKDGSIEYGYGRSWSLAYGSVKVEIGKNATWEELVAASRTHKRKGSWPLKVTSITEMGRFPKSPLPLIERDGEIIVDPDAGAKIREAQSGSHGEIRRRLALTPTKEVFIYVHGFNNTFEYAAFVFAELWHFAGRRGVPILYSWPAASPGLLRGYTHDRESGQFSVHHLKRTIEELAKIPEIEKINVISHSRGTDVAATALRELLIRARAAGLDPRQEYRIRTVVFASPDLDFDVISQRFSAVRFFEITERLTVYVSKHDQAIGLADWLYASRERLGKVRPEDLDPYARAFLAHAAGVTDVVDANVKTSGLGHNYYHSNPAVSSDLILAVWGDAAVGSPQRPLTEIIPGYWAIDEQDYPFLGADK
jgi:esterase/lipase superfamily enzyme